MEFINSNKAPAAIGPYSQAIIYQGILYSSGQIGLVKETGNLISDNIKDQTRQCLSNIEAILKEAQSNISSILKVVIFLRNMADFSTVNEIYQEWIGNHRPARSTIAVLGLPRDALIEIECIAKISAT